MRRLYTGSIWSPGEVAVEWSQPHAPAQGRHGQDFGTPRGRRRLFELAVR